MRGSLARLAKQASEKYLTPGNPTGLTGLATSPAPRPILINIYNSTLASLKKLPSDSAYRTSAEALTKHRLSILQNIKPAGYDAWLKRVTEKHPNAVRAAEKEGRIFAVDPVIKVEYDYRYTSWDGESEAEAIDEGPIPSRPGDGNLKPAQEVPEQIQQSESQPQQSASPRAEEAVIEMEPPLTAEQVSEIEQKIGAGLIEEVIEVAKGEQKLVDVLTEYKVWEELEEKAPEGQWSYFER